MDLNLITVKLLQVSTVGNFQKRMLGKTSIDIITKAQATKAHLERETRLQN